MMLSLLFVLGLLAAQSAGVPDADWTEHVDAEGGFAFSVPGTPQPETVQPPKEGATAVHVHRLETNEDGRSVTYMVTWNDMPWLQGDSGMMLRALVDGVRTAGHNIVAEREISLGGLSGRELQIDAAGATFFQRVYVDAEKKRAFQVIFGSAAAHASADRARFFESFRFTRRRE